MELWDIYDKDRNKTGRTIERGLEMNQDEYYLTVDVWIRNSSGKYLITKRTPNKTYPNMWEATGGAAVSGDDSITAALREVEEEIGIKLKSCSGVMIKSIRRENGMNKSFKDVWLFEEDVNLEDVVHQENEVSDSMWASESDIKQMIKKGQFVNVFTYIENVFNFNIENRLDS